MKIITALFAIFSIQATFAEYRVYQYYVKSSFATEDQNAHLVTSTLDPESYKAYHGGGASVQVNLLRSWMCKGHTGNKKELCESPAKTVNKFLRESDGVK